MVEGARLESVCALPGTVGSNPTLSAIVFCSIGDLHIVFYHFKWDPTVT